MSLFSCNEQAKKKEAPENQNTETEQNDETELESKFLNFYYKQYPRDSVSLTNESLILGDETFALPDFSEITGKTWYGKNHLFELELILKTNNEVSFKYELAGLNKDESQSGIAWLQPSFYLSSEIDENHITEEAYEVIEYVDQTKDHYLAIRIGKDSKGLAAKIVIQPEVAKKQDMKISLEDSPVLRPK